jgi:YD repeat-containing protein
MLYFYDAEGQRVGKRQTDTLEDYVYDPQRNHTSAHEGGGNVLRSEVYASSETAWSYDTMGRVLEEERTVGSVTKTLPYTYNLDGALVLP